MKCFDPNSFECIDFHGLSQSIASLTRERLTERERLKSVISIGHRRKRTTPWQSADLVFALDAPRNQCSAFTLLPMKMAILWKTSMNRAGGCANIGARFPKHALKARGTIAMRLSCDTSRKHRTTFDGKLTETNLMNSWPQKKSPLLALMGFHIASTVVREAWVLSFSATRTNMCFRVAPSLIKSSDVDDNGRIVRSPEPLRPLTLCNCDCKVLTTAICRGLQWFTMRRIHPSQRCISSRHMTDNIFEIESTALAHVACTPCESAILLTDFAAPYPSVNHSWIFHVLEKTELPEFTCRFLRRIYYDSTTHVEFAGSTRGQFLMARGVRQGCPASGFLFAMAFDPIIRWLQDAIIPRNPAGLELLQPVSCACADDLAVAASSFRCSMTAWAPAFQIMDQSSGST